MLFVYNVLLIHIILLVTFFGMLCRYYMLKYIVDQYILLLYCWYILFVYTVGMYCLYILLVHTVGIYCWCLLLVYTVGIYC